MVDATPAQLVEVAAGAGARAVCLFVEPIAVLPQMPAFNLFGDTPERRRTRARMDDLGVELDLAYPFTLAGRTEIEAFCPALEAASYLGAYAVNVLVYDRIPARRTEKFAAFCELALSFDLKVVVEFYPASQVRSLGEALALTATVGADARIGVNVDLLHLIRSGGSIADVSAAPTSALLYAQYCDAPSAGDPALIEAEASSQRLYPGQGELPVAAFAASLPVGLRTSVEAPREDLRAAGLSRADRASMALNSTTKALEGVVGKYCSR